MVKGSRQWTLDGRLFLPCNHLYALKASCGPAIVTLRVDCLNVRIMDDERIEDQNVLNIVESSRHAFYQRFGDIHACRTIAAI